MAKNKQAELKAARREDRAAKASSRTLRTLLKAQQKQDGVYRGSRRGIWR